MAAIPGFRFDITGASGSQGLLSPRQSWQAYVFPRGGNAAQDSTGTLITFDSAAIASRFTANNWIQVGTDTANIRQVTAVGGNSMSINSAVTVTENDRIFLIGNTQPSVVGGSATYITPNTLIRQRGDDAADLYANSMITTNANGLVQGYASPAMYDVLVQDGNQSNQGYIADLEVGTVEGVSVTDWAFFGSTVTIHANAGITGSLTVGTTLTVGTSMVGSIVAARGPGAVRYASLFSTAGSSTSGIQEAINDLPAGGGTVILNAGTTYTITAQITSVTNLTLRGLDRMTSVIVSTNNNINGIVLSDNATLQNFTLRGTSVYTSGSDGIDGGSTDDATVDGLIVEQWSQNGISLASNSTRCRVINCTVRDNKWEGIYAGTSCTECIISNNIIYGNAKNGIDVNGTRCVISGNISRNNGVSPDTTDTFGILVGHASGFTSTDNVVVGNICDGNAGNGIFIWGAGTVRRYTIADNICSNTTDGWGIAMTGGSNGIFDLHTVRGNVCYNNNADGISINGVDDSSFVGNVCTGNGGDGIQMYAQSKVCARNIVKGNILRSNTGRGFLADHSDVTSSIICDNLITGNGAPQIGTISSATNMVYNNGPVTSTLTQAATLAATADGDFFGVSGTIGAGTSISTITPLLTGRQIVLWAAAGTMGFSQSNTLKIMGASFNVPPNGAVKAYCTGTTWFIFSPSS